MGNDVCKSRSLVSYVFSFATVMFFSLNIILEVICILMTFLFLHIITNVQHATAIIIQTDYTLFKKIKAHLIIHYAAFCTFLPLHNFPRGTLRLCLLNYAQVVS